MLPTDKTELLQSFLGKLPKDAASRLASAVEIDRLTEGKALPHEAILEGLRPVLRSDEAKKRTPTPLRLFCTPFEDLLVNTPRAERQKGRLMRPHVMPIWHWVSQTLVPTEAKAYSNEIRRFVLMKKHEEALARAGHFWPVAGEAITTAIAKDRAAAVAALGGETVVADAEDIALLLKAGQQMIAVQDLLPKPTPSLNEELLAALRLIYDEVLRLSTDTAPFISVVAMRRLARPWEALKLALNVARQTQDTLISSTDMGLAGDVLFCDMEDARVALMAIRQPVFDVEYLVRNLASFTNISSAIVKEVEILRHGRWGQRLLKDRAAIGEVMDSFMDRAPKEIAGALPTYKAGFSGGPKIPDFRHRPDPDRIDRALRYARVLSRTKLYAVPGSFGAKHQNTVDEIAQYLRSYNEDAMKELRAAEGDKRPVVEQQFLLAFELSSHVFDDSELDLLRRRGRAAGADLPLPEPRPDAAAGQITAA